MPSKPSPDQQIQRTYRLRIALFLLCCFIILILSSTIYQGINTLHQLDVIEHERDQWQRSSEIIKELNLRNGSVVADLGCGSGYFALQLSAAAGGNGKVLAVDLRRLSLAFLWMRTILRNQHNVSIIRSESDDPHLSGTVDAVLIVNTYHELAHPKLVLGHVFRALVSGGRLVVADRGPETSTGESRETEVRHHELASGLVEQDLREGGFEIVRREDHFLDQPDEGPWWLIVARRP